MKIVKVLGRLKEIMQEVERIEGRIDMREFYEGKAFSDDPSFKTIHECDTPACIIGWGALDPELSLMVLESTLDYTEHPMYLHSRPRGLWLRIEHLVDVETRMDGDDFCEALFGGSTNERYNALLSLVGKTTLLDLPFFGRKGEEHTSKEVIEVLDGMIELIKENAK